MYSFHVELIKIHLGGYFIDAFHSDIFIYTRSFAFNCIKLSFFKYKSFREHIATIIVVIYVSFKERIVIMVVCRDNICSIYLNTHGNRSSTHET